MNIVATTATDLTQKYVKANNHHLQKKKKSLKVCITVSMLFYHSSLYWYELFI